MPPALHPRSNYTTSLFGLTLVVSFVVVGIPHILPCPVDPRQFADAKAPDGRVVRRRRAQAQPVDTDNNNISESDAKAKRECPVPKPTGVLGQMLGFKQDKRPAVHIVNEKARGGSDES